MNRLSYDEAHAELLEAHMNDWHYFTETFTEMSDVNRKEIVDAVLKGDSKLVGDLVTDALYRYCSPDSDDVQTFINDRIDYK